MSCFSRVHISWHFYWRCSIVTGVDCLCLQITIVSFLVSDSIPFTTVELLQIEPADMSVDGAGDRVQIIGKKQGAKGPVSFIHSILPSYSSISHSLILPFPILYSHSSVYIPILHSHSSMFTFPFFIPILLCLHFHSSFPFFYVYIPVFPSSMLNPTW